MERDGNQGQRTPLWISIEKPIGPEGAKGLANGAGGFLMADGTDS
jgi:hypothetical protein